MKVEITEVQRLTVKPGDRLIVRVPGRLRADEAVRLREMLRFRLGIPDDVPFAILDSGMSVEVVEGL